MAIGRRGAVLGLGAMGLAGCGGGFRRIGSGAATRRAPIAPAEGGMRAEPNAAFDAWTTAFRSRGLAAGIDAAILDPALERAGFVPGVIERDRNQTEFTRTLEDYLQIAASDDRVRTGRARFGEYRAPLGRIAARYGVPGEVITAIWGLESRYGARRGDIEVVSATATLAFDGRRGAFFEEQLIAALRILQSGDTAPGTLRGSWAGAMGHTQFIPTSYQAYAVDFTGDGRRDIWSEDPTDALASAANYLARAGWAAGQPWGIEVQVPGEVQAPGRGDPRPVAAWRALGVTRPTGGPLPDHGPAALIQPEGPGTPGFLAFGNFDVIARYNNATSYVIGIGHLSDRIAGGGRLAGRFGPDRHGLLLQDRIALQRRLTAAGFDTGGIDGVIGPGTRAAIEAYEAASGLPVTGEPSPGLLDRLG